MPLGFSLRLLKQIMANSPLIAIIPVEKLRTRKVKHLPPVEPLAHALSPIRLNKMRPNRTLRSRHLGIPVLARLGIVLSIHPPLLLELQVALEVQQQIGRRHRAAREKVLRHPARFEIVGRALVREQVHEEFAAGFEEGGDFGEELLVVFHVLEELDAEHAVVGTFLRRAGEGVGGDIAGDDFEVLEAGFVRAAVDVLFLRARVGEGGDVAVGEDLGEVETQGAPAATDKNKICQPALPKTEERLNTISRASTHPKSKIFIPSFNPARSTYNSNIAISACASVSPPLG